MLYTSEMESGSSHEDWYDHDNELGCTVCAAPSAAAVYTRWGSRTCPSDSTLMYEGFMASGHHGHHGDGYNTLCMTQHSHAPPGASTGNHDGQLLYGMEYENTGAIDKNHNGDAACAVCRHATVSSTYTEWGRYGSCSAAGHTPVYTGVIMANRYTEYKSESVCVDLERAVHAGSSTSDQNGGRLYTSELEHGSAHGGWYQHDIELGCTVCVVTSEPTSCRSCPANTYSGPNAGTCTPQAERYTAVGKGSCWDAQNNYPSYKGVEVPGTWVVGSTFAEKCYQLCISEYGTQCSGFDTRPNRQGHWADRGQCLIYTNSGNSANNVVKGTRCSLNGNQPGCDPNTSDSSGEYWPCYAVNGA